MDITVLSKARFDALMQDIKNLEAQIQMAHTQLKAMQETNNNFAEIAFDENRFTDELITRCEDAAREAAKDAIDVDDIASEVGDRIDISEDVQRAVNRLDLVTEDKVNDMVEEYINDNNLLNTDEVEDVVSDYISHNCDYVEKNVTDELHDEIQELKREMQSMREGIAHEVLQLIADKLTERREALLRPPVESNGHDQLSQ